MEICNCNRKHWSKPIFSYSREGMGHFDELSTHDEAEVLDDGEYYTISSISTSQYCTSCGADKSNEQSLSEFTNMLMDSNDAD